MDKNVGYNLIGALYLGFSICVVSGVYLSRGTELALMTLAGLFILAIAGIAAELDKTKPKEPSDGRDGT